MSRIHYLLCGWMLLLSAPLWAAGDATFLLRTPQYAASGFSGVAAALGAENVFINPSILAGVSSNIFEACYGNYFSALSTTTLMLTRSGDLWGGSFAFGYMNNRIDGLVQTDDYTHDTKPDVISSMGYFSQAFSLDYYNTISGMINVSFGGRYIEEGVSGIKNADHPWYASEEKGTGIGFHLGVSSMPMVLSGGQLQLGAAVYDLNDTVLAWHGMRESIPQSYQFGFSWRQPFGVWGYSLQCDSGSDGLAYGGGVFLPDSGLTLQAGRNAFMTGIGLSFDARMLGASLAYITHDELGGSYSFAVTFPIVPEPEKHNIKKIEQEFSTIKGETSSGLSGTDLISTMNIDDELESIKEQNSSLFSKNNEYYTLSFIPSGVLYRGLTVKVNLEPKSIKVNRVRIRLGSQRVDLSSDSTPMQDVPDRFREIIQSSISKSFTGNLVLPDLPGTYQLNLILETDSGSSVFKEMIQVK